MEAVTFPDVELQEVLRNKVHFVKVLLPDLPAWCSSWGVMQYPTFVVLNSRRNIIDWFSGFHSVESMTDSIEVVLRTGGRYASTEARIAKEPKKIEAHFELLGLAHGGRRWPIVYEASRTCIELDRKRDFKSRTVVLTRYAEAGFYIAIRMKDEQERRGLLERIAETTGELVDREDVTDTQAATALYFQASVLDRLDRHDEALESIRILVREHSSARWIHGITYNLMMPYWQRLGPEDADLEPTHCQICKERWKKFSKPK